MSKATFLENTVFLSRSNLLTFSGIWSMVFGFWQKVFGRKFLAGFSWQQSVLLRELFQILLQVFFYLFLVWSDVSFDLWQNFHSRFVKISFLFFFQKLFELINFENFKRVSKNSDSDRSFFHNFDERFPAALCKLHSKCPEEHSEDIFLSENTGNVLSISSFW